jgi:hypothetical protein
MREARTFLVAFPLLGPVFNLDLAALKAKCVTYQEPLLPRLLAWFLAVAGERELPFERLRLRSHFRRDFGTPRTRATSLAVANRASIREVILLGFYICIVLVAIELPDVWVFSSRLGHG